MKTRRIVMVGLLTAMYVVLSLYLTVTLWNYKLTFEALPILICALMYGPADGFLVGFLGSFLNQMLTYGFTSTTLLWVLPHAASGLFAGWLGKRIKRPLKPAVTCLVTVSSALAVTALNTFAMYVDSKVNGYYSKAFIFGALGARLLTGIAMAVAFSLLLPVLRDRLEKAVGRD